MSKSDAFFREYPIRILNAEEEQLDTDNSVKWYALCETHGSLQPFTKKKEAQWWSRSGRQGVWCEKCTELLPDGFFENVLNEDTQFCSSCGIEKSLTEYSKCHIYECNTCRNQKHRHREQTQPERKQHRKDIWQKNKQNPEYIKTHAEYRAIWYEKNKDRQNELARINYQQNKEAYNARSKVWYKKNPCLRYEYKKRREANIKNLKSDGHTQAEKHQYWKDQGIDPKRCTYCDDWHTKWPNNWKTSIGDHVIPVSRGGSNTLDNLMPACSTCNSKKGPKLLSEWTQPKHEKKAA
jgi:hypothetical protein